VLEHTIVAGIPFGCVYALVGLGLVITYRAAGVFNFAFGAQAYLSAAVFYATVHTARWPVWAGGLVAIVVSGVGVGLVLDRGLFRYLRSASVMVKLVVSLGLLVAIPAVVGSTGFGSGTKLAPPDLGPTPAVLLGGPGALLDTNQLAVIIATVLIAGGLGALFRWTNFGLRLRAVVESPRLAQLAGVNAEAVGSGAWVVSSIIAGLAGVLLAPLYGQVRAMDFDTLVVAAIAAAVVGGLSSFSLTVAGGLLLGVGQDLITAYLPLGSTFTQSLRPSLPFILLVLVLVVAGPRLSKRRMGDDPMAGLDTAPTSAGPARAAGWGGLAGGPGDSGRRGGLAGGPGDSGRRGGLAGGPGDSGRRGGLAGGPGDSGRRGGLAGWAGGWRSAGLGGLAGVAALAVGLLVLPPYWLFLGSECAALAVVFCSFTVLTGMGGQLSLCQAELAGIGAFAAGQLAIHENLSVIAGLGVGFGLALVVGLVVAIPALRVSGLYLALATFAFGLLIDNIGFSPTWSGNGNSGILVPRPLIGPVSFNATRPFFVLALVVLAIVAAGVAWLRRSTAGRYLVAVRGSELAAASVGINVRRVKVVAFGLAAGIAGLGGALYGTTLGAVSASNFTFYQSLFWLVVVAITGVRTVGGAVAAGVVVVVVPQLLSLEGGGLASLDAVIFGFGALSYIRHPEGLVVWLRRRTAEVLQWPRRRLA
jgi:branched-chain amino acid transport system permease protein